MLVSCSTLFRPKTEEKKQIDHCEKCFIKLKCKAQCTAISLCVSQNKGSHMCLERDEGESFILLLLLLLMMMMLYDCRYLSSL